MLLSKIDAMLSRKPMLLASAELNVSPRERVDSSELTTGKTDDLWGLV